MVVRQRYKLRAVAVGLTDANDVGEVWHPRWLHAREESRRARCWSELGRAREERGLFVLKTNAAASSGESSRGRERHRKVSVWDGFWLVRRTWTFSFSLWDVPELCFFLVQIMRFTWDETNKQIPPPKNLLLSFGSWVCMGFVFPDFLRLHRSPFSWKTATVEGL